jgi:hypothetical protein
VKPVHDHQLLMSASHAAAAAAIQQQCWQASCCKHPLMLLLPTSRCHVCSALRWLPRCSLIKHAFEALCINEFEGLEFQLDEGGRGMRTGKTAGKHHTAVILRFCVWRLQGGFCLVVAVVLLGIVSA